MINSLKADTYLLHLRFTA